MEVHIRVSGTLLGYLQSGSIVMQLGDGATVSNLLEHMEMTHERRSALVVVVNGELAGENTELRDGDHIKLLLRISGG